MARKSEAQLRTIGGKSRDGQISVMLRAGVSNAAILSALEHGHSEYIPDSDPRRDASSPLYIDNMSAFDKIARQRCQEAIRSCRKQQQDVDVDIENILEITGDSGVEALVETEHGNTQRFSTGQRWLDRIYGKSYFIHTEDDTSGNWIQGDPMLKGLKGEYRRVRNNDGSMIGDLDMSLQVTMEGMPESFLSIWAGEPGVGKTRTAISICKSLNRVEREQGTSRPILYFNGESEKKQFRQWAGSDIDPELFLVRHDEFVRTETVINDILKYQPRLVIVDSLQMIAETKGGAAATDGIFSRLKQVKADPDAGFPHIVLISQLNKQGDLAGRKSIEHMVDFSALLSIWQGREGQFLFECPRKNRAGPTQKGAICMHLSNGIKCLNEDYRKMTGPIKLTQPMAPVSVPAVIVGAVEDSDNRILMRA